MVTWNKINKTKYESEVQGFKFELFYFCKNNSWMLRISTIEFTGLNILRAIEIINPEETKEAQISAYSIILSWLLILKEKTTTAIHLLYNQGE